MTADARDGKGLAVVSGCEGACSGPAVGGSCSEGACESARVVVGVAGLRSGRAGSLVSTRRRSLLGALCLLVLVLGVGGLVGSGVAVAARSHAFSFGFGGPGGGAGGLELAPSVVFGESPGSGVAVDDATGDVFVADSGNRRVDEFSSAGVFIRAWGWGVENNTEHKLQACVSSCEAGLSGTEPGEFVTPSYVAVDNDPSSESFGDVYVADTGDQKVTKFTDTGVLVGSWGDGGQLSGNGTESFVGPLAGMAVDGKGRLWVLAYNSHLFGFEPNGISVMECDANKLGVNIGGLAVAGASEAPADEVLYAIGGSEAVRLSGGCTVAGVVAFSSGLRPSGLGVDTSDGDVYVDEGGEFVEDVPSAGCVPGSRGCPASQVLGEEELGEATGVGINPDSGSMYVASAKTDQVMVFGLVLEAMIGSVGGVTSGSAVLHGTANPVGAELSRCTFEYGETSGEYEKSVACGEALGSIGKGDSPVAVQASVTGLTGGKTYYFRLHASNANGNAYSEAGSFTTTKTARIEEASVAVTGGRAALTGTVNPEGSAAHYRFEYGECASVFECAGTAFTGRLPEPDGLIAAGSSPVEVSANVEGLAVGVTYHYRLVAEDAAGVAASEEGTFIGEPAGPECHGERRVLPDCRAYELVTPADKNAALIDNGVGLAPPAIAEDGSRVMVMSIQCFGGAQSCIAVRQTEGQPYALERTSGGWDAVALAPSASTNSSALGYDADTGMVLYSMGTPAPGLEEFFAEEAAGLFAPIGPVSDESGFVAGNIAIRELDFTSDLSRMLYQTEKPFASWPALAVGASGFYVAEYSGRDGSAPVLVNVSGGAGSTSLLGSCGARLGSVDPGAAGANRFGALSSDGHTVFFTVYGCGSGVTVPADEVWERVEGVGGTRSVLVSGPGPGGMCGVVCEGQPVGDAEFQGASEDGSRVFFTSTQQLTDSASEDRRHGDSAAEGCARTAASASGCNLYEFECPDLCESASDERLFDLSAGDVSGLGPQVQGVVAIAPDGSDVFFVAHGVLSDVANGEGSLPVPGGENLYVSSPSGGTKFIATLSKVDGEEWEDGLGVANVSPEGRFLVFTSHRGLTADALQGEGPAQVYRYDVVTGQLLRVSVGEQGFNDDGNDAAAAAGSPNVVENARIVDERLGYAMNGPHRGAPSMSDNGMFVFFQSPRGLTPGALNDVYVTGNAPSGGGPGVLAENVYEWAADGAHYGEGSASTQVCEQPGGCVWLISDGRDVTEGTGQHGNESAVELLGTDATGENVFFWTADQLVSEDKDSQIDLYDARVNGGFPAEPAPVSCGGLEECRPPSVPGPSFGVPPSTVFAGAGNLIPPSLTTRPAEPPLSKHVLTRAQKLADALKACRREDKGHKKSSQRVRCERRARASYGAVKKKLRSRRRGVGGGSDRRGES